MSFIREPDAEPIPGYRLIEPLGSGGFGEVWKCDAPGGIYKAIKFVYGNLNSLDVDGARAEQEQRALNRVKEIRHPFVLPMDRIEVVEGELVIVMELADKQLARRLRGKRPGRSGRHPARRLAALPPRRGGSARSHEREARPAAPRHQAAQPLPHQRSRQGRRFRPRQAPRTLAGPRVCSAASRRCTPRRKRSAATSIRRSDQYSLAIVYQELLTGQRPFNGKNARLLAQQHLSERPELRALPEPDRPIVERAFSKDPNNRFPNCIAFIRALYNATRLAASAPLWLAATDRSRWPTRWTICSSASGTPTTSWCRSISTAHPTPRAGIRFGHDAGTAADRSLAADAPHRHRQFRPPRPHGVALSASRSLRRPGQAAALAFPVPRHRSRRDQVVVARLSGSGPQAARGPPIAAPAGTPLSPTAAGAAERLAAARQALPDAALAQTTRLAALATAVVHRQLPATHGPHQARDPDSHPRRRDLSVGQHDRPRPARQCAAHVRHCQCQLAAAAASCQTLVTLSAACYTIRCTTWKRR